MSHRAAALLAVVFLGWLLSQAPSGQARVAVAVYGVCAIAMFTFSALVHYRPWSAETTEVLFRLDHTGIFLMIAGTSTAIALLGLVGWQRPLLLWGTWGLTAIGITIIWLPFATPRGLAMTFFLGIGWLSVLLVPSLYAQTGWSTVSLLLSGGALYTVGAVVVARRRPDPNPSVFGYHEIWHLFVIGAFIVHTIMIGTTLLPLIERAV